MTVSPNFNDRLPGIPIDMLVIHYTGMETCEQAKTRLCDPEAQVSCHYLIEQDGTVHRLVDEDKRAWHAGVAWWRGAVDVNAHSIGIELVNPGHEFGYQNFPEPQMIALTNLARSILSRHPIVARNVIGHSDVAPRRKQDPGERFDWHRLADVGVGVWVEKAPPLNVTDEQMGMMLTAYGYSVMDLKATVSAFQRHFRPSNIEGVIDGETAGLLKLLLDAN